jgi:hypothetical protein
MTGDHFYLLEKVSQNVWEIKGSGDIRPKLEKGMYDIYNMPLKTGTVAVTTMYVKEDESQQEYNARVVAPTLAFIKTGKVYISKNTKNRTRYVKKDSR